MADQILIPPAPCPQCTPAGNECMVSQVLEPTDPTLVAVSSGSIDPAITEQGSLDLNPGDKIVSVTFNAMKCNENYRFEYLYVDNLSGEVVLQGYVVPIPIAQTVFGFSVDLTGQAIVPGSILRWRVVVIDLSVIGDLLDQPQSLYLQLPMVNLFVVNLANPRSTTDYGFDELRVENLADTPSAQTPIAVQVVAKTQTTFTIAMSPSP